jgi:hypothetical protein
MKSFTSLPPSDFYVEDHTITYTIPYHQIVHGRPNTRYTIQTDFDFAFSECVSYLPLYTPQVYPLQTNTFPNASVNGVTLHEEEISKEPFRLREGAQFADVEVATQIRVVLNTYNNMNWKWTFHEIMTMPYESIETTDYIYFVDPPRYQVTLHPPYCDMTTIENFLRIALPESLQNYDFGITS